MRRWLTSVSGPLPSNAQGIVDSDGVDCSRISGPCVGPLSPWPRWKVARGVPIA